MNVDYQVNPGTGHRARAAAYALTALAVLLLAAWSASAQTTDIFMRIGGQAATMGSTQTAPTLAGESADPQYTNWIPVISVSHSVSRQLSFSGSSVNFSSPSHAEVSAFKPTDKTTPSINLLVNGGVATVTQPVDYVTIDFRKSGSNQVFYRIELQGVYFSSSAIDGGSGGSPTDSMTLFYTKIRWSYLSYDALGKAGATVTKGWDVAGGKAF